MFRPSFFRSLRRACNLCAVISDAAFFFFQPSEEKHTFWSRVFFNLPAQLFLHHYLDFLSGFEKGVKNTCSVDWTKSQVSVWVCGFVPEWHTKKVEAMFTDILLAVVHKARKKEVEKRGGRIIGLFLLVGWRRELSGLFDSIWGWQKIDIFTLPPNLFWFRISIGIYGVLGESSISPFPPSCSDCRRASENRSESGGSQLWRC